MINKLYITRNSPQWYMESAVDFSRDLKRIKGYWSLPKSPSAVKRDVCFNVDIALTLLKGRLPGMSE